MKVVVILPVEKIDVREHKGTKYYDAVSVQELYNASGDVVSRQTTRIAVDPDHLPEVTKAVQDARGRPIALSVRAAARQGKAGGYPWVSYYGAQVWSGEL